MISRVFSPCAALSAFTALTVINTPSLFAQGTTNTNGGNASFIGAGTNNNIVGPVNFSLIGAGRDNTINSAANNSVIIGGRTNTIAVNANRSTIAGGSTNFIGTASAGSTIVGGDSNVISAINPALGSSLWATIGGGLNNLVGSNGSAATIGGGARNQALGRFTGVASGQGNIVADFSTGSVIGGGVSNSITATEFFEVDEFDQIIATNPAVATIAGGGSNTVSGAVSFVGGGAFNTNNGWFSVIVGGINNTISGFDEQSQASADSSFIGGGERNVIASTGYASVIGGGFGNVARGEYSSISGGELNSAESWGIVPGGYANEAGIDSFAAGNLAKATNIGSFVWNGYYDESETVTTTSTNDYSFTVRAPGGARFITTTATNNLAPNNGFSNGVILVSGGTQWQSLSDSNSKTDFKPIEPREILSKVAALPLTSWHYKHDSQRRYIGPMSQDFHAAFGLGSDTQTIGTLDSDGVIYAAIQGLVEEIKLRDEKIAKLEAWSREQSLQLKELTGRREARSQIEVDELKAKLQAFEERLDALPPAP